MTLMLDWNYGNSKNGVGRNSVSEHAKPRTKIKTSLDLALPCTYQYEQSDFCHLPEWSGCGQTEK